MRQIIETWQAKAEGLKHVAQKGEKRYYFETSNEVENDALPLRFECSPQFKIGASMPIVGLWKSLVIFNHPTPPIWLMNQLPLIEVELPGFLTIISLGPLYNPRTKNPGCPKVEGIP